MQETIREFRNEYFFLSNFYMRNDPIVHPESLVSFPSVEHAFQALKSKKPLFHEIISKLPTPKAAKKLGRGVALRADWEEVKDQIMLDLLKDKFHSKSRLATLLDRTGDARLIEGNTWHDNYWGDCSCGRKACEGYGRNVLGISLEIVRYSLRENLMP